METSIVAKQRRPLGGRDATPVPAPGCVRRYRIYLFTANLTILIDISDPSDRTDASVLSRGRPAQCGPHSTGHTARGRDLRLRDQRVRRGDLSRSAPVDSRGNRLDLRSRASASTIVGCQPGRMRLKLIACEVLARELAEAEETVRVDPRRYSPLPQAHRRPVGRRGLSVDRAGRARRAEWPT